eukprot:m.272513 g.272513  ORF g.272513 m.272513 type:complete len:553 (-) comp16273_c0_seq1:1373-3031(-)
MADLPQFSAAEVDEFFETFQAQDNDNTATNLVFETQETSRSQQDWAKTLLELFVEVWEKCMNVNQLVIEKHFPSPLPYQNCDKLDKLISKKKIELKSKLSIVETKRKIKDINKTLKDESKRYVWGPNILGNVGSRLEECLLDMYHSFVGSNRNGEDGGSDSSPSPSLDKGGEDNSRGKHSSPPSRGHKDNSPHSRQGGGTSNNSQNFRSSKRPREHAVHIIKTVTNLIKMASERNLRMRDIAFIAFSKHVIKCLQKFPDDEEVNMYGCCALRMLEYLSQEYQNNVLDAAELIQAISSVIRNQRFQRSVAVQLETCKALRFLLSRDATAKIHAEEISPLLSIFMHTPEFLSEEIQKNLIKCWISIMKATENIHAKCLHQEKFQIIEHVVKVMRKYPRNEKIQGDSCRLVLLFSELIKNKMKLNQEDRDKLGESLHNALKWVSKAMDHYTDLRVDCCQYIRNLAEWATPKNIQIRCEPEICRAMYWLTPDNESYDICKDALNAVVHSNKQTEPHYGAVFAREIQPEINEIYGDCEKVVKDVMKANTKENIYVIT